MNKNTLDVAELKAHIELILKIQEKLDSLKEDYYKIVSKEDFEQMEELLSQPEDEIRKIEVSL